MDILERFSNKFGKWYEGLFGEESSELRPKDVLRKIIAAMEENRKEGFDSKVYVPNKYVLELAVDDPEERDYLLSFLDEEELETVLKRFMAQNKYETRGPLDFTIAEVPEDERSSRKDKLRVKVRFEKGEMARPEPPAPTPRALRPEPFPVTPGDDLPTVAAAADADDMETVAAIAWASLAITPPDGRKRNESLIRKSISIGRSRNLGNDIVLAGDGQVSKMHARIDREADGGFTVYDLGSMNGVLVNGRRIDGNVALKDGDEILIGATTLVYHRPDAEVHAQEGAAP